MPGECKPCADNLKEELNNFNTSACGENSGQNPPESFNELKREKTELPEKEKNFGSRKKAEEQKISEAEKAAGEKVYKQEAEKPVSALPQKPEIINEEKADKEERTAFFEKALSFTQGLNDVLIDLYTGFFKNNAAFKITLGEIEKGFEEYVQAVIISKFIENGNGGESALEFVYKALPRGDLFGETKSESEAADVVKRKSREIPMAFLMATAVDVSFKKDYSIRIIDGIYGAYSACVSAFGMPPCEKNELTRDLCAFAKKQGVTGITV